MEQSHVIDQVVLQSIRVAASMSSNQTFGRVTILQLLSFVDALEAEVKESKKIEEAAVHKLSVAGRELDSIKKERDSLRKENDGLGEEISDLKRQKPAPVVLPKEVAAALEQIKASRGYSAEQLAYYAVQSPTYPYGAITPEISTLRDYANEFHALDLVNAIQFGYTVEEPIDHEQRLRIDIERLVTTWDRTRPTSSLVKDIDERLDDYFQEIAK